MSLTFISPPYESLDNGNGRIRIRHRCGDETKITKALNDYLWGKSPIEEAAYALHETAGNDPGRGFLKGLNIWLIPSSIRTGEIARILREGYDVGLLNEGFHTLLDKLKLDYLFIDTHPGLN